jgi:hypothetical protein
MPEHTFHRRRQPAGLEAFRERLAVFGIVHECRAGGLCLGGRLFGVPLGRPASVSSTLTTSAIQC